MDFAGVYLNKVFKRKNANLNIKQFFLKRIEDRLTLELTGIILRVIFNPP